MSTETITIQSSLGGSSSIARETETSIKRNITVAAALAATATAPVASASTATLGISHGIETSDEVGVFWTGGRRVGLTVDSTASTTISILTTTGEGTAWPARQYVVSRW